MAQNQSKFQLRNFTLKECNMMSTGIFQLIYCSLVKQHCWELDRFESMQLGCEPARFCTCEAMDSLSGMLSREEEANPNHPALRKRRYCFSFLCTRGILLNIARACPPEYRHIMDMQQGILMETAYLIYSKTLHVSRWNTTPEARKAGTLNVIETILPDRKEIANLQHEVVFLLGLLEQDMLPFMAKPKPVRPELQVRREGAKIGAPPGFQLNSPQLSHYMAYRQRRLAKQQEKDNVLGLVTSQEIAATHSHCLTRFTNANFDTDFRWGADTEEAYQQRHKRPMVAFDKMFPQFLKEDYAGLRQTFCQARPQRNTVPLVLERLLSDDLNRPCKTRMDRILARYRAGTAGGLEAKLSVLADYQEYIYAMDDPAWSNLEMDPVVRRQEARPDLLQRVTDKVYQLNLAEPVAGPVPPPCSTFKQEDFTAPAFATAEQKPESPAGACGGKVLPEPDLRNLACTPGVLGGVSSKMLQSAKSPQATSANNLPEVTPRPINVNFTDETFEALRVEARRVWADDPELNVPKTIFVLDSDTDKLMLEHQREADLLAAYSDVSMLHLVYKWTFNFPKVVSGRYPQ